MHGSTGVKARVEDPFQLVGMNALGLPGASIDGILGFTILARFRLEIDLTKDRMTWTRLDHEPRDPPVPRGKPGEDAGAPLGVQAMSALGPLAKGLAFLMGKQPEDELVPAASWGWSGPNGSKRAASRSRSQGVLKGSPAARGGLQPATGSFGSTIGQSKTSKDGRAALAEVHAGDSGAAGRPPRRGYRHPRAETDAHRRGGPLEHGHTNDHDQSCCEIHRPPPDAVRASSRLSAWLPW